MYISIEKDYKKSRTLSEPGREAINLFWPMPENMISHSILKSLPPRLDPVSVLECGRAREERAVDSVDDRLCADLATAEKPAVESFDGVLAALDTVELEVDVALGVGI